MLREKVIFWLIYRVEIAAFVAFVALCIYLDRVLGFLSVMYHLQIAYKMFCKINVLCVLKYEFTPKTTVHILTHSVDMISILAALEYQLGL